MTPAIQKIKQAMQDAIIDIDRADECQRLCSYIPGTASQKLIAERLSTAAKSIAAVVDIITESVEKKPTAPTLERYLNQ